jgi:hypothetical protein
VPHRAECIQRNRPVRGPGWRVSPLCDILRYSGEGLEVDHMVSVLAATLMALRAHRKAVGDIEDLFELDQLHWTVTQLYNALNGLDNAELVAVLINSARIQLIEVVMRKRARFDEEIFPYHENLCFGREGHTGRMQTDHPLLFQRNRGDLVQAFGRFADQMQQIATNAGQRFPDAAHVAVFFHTMQAECSGAKQRLEFEEPCGAERGVDRTRRLQKEEHQESVQDDAASGARGYGYGH